MVSSAIVMVYLWDGAFGFCDSVSRNFIFVCVWQLYVFLITSSTWGAAGTCKSWLVFKWSREGARFLFVNRGFTGACQCPYSPPPDTIHRDTPRQNSPQTHSTETQTKFTPRHNPQRQNSPPDTIRTDTDSVQLHTRAQNLLKWYTTRCVISQLQWSSRKMASVKFR